MGIDKKDHFYWRAFVTFYIVLSFLPKDVYVKAVGAAKPASVPLAEGGGYGQKSVQQIADQLNIPLDTAIERLHQAGISQAAPDSNLRELATASSRRPFEIAHIIQGNAGS